MVRRLLIRGLVERCRFVCAAGHGAGRVIQCCSMVEEPGGSTLSDDEVKRVNARMGTRAWSILQALVEVRIPLPGFEIIRIVEANLRGVDDPNPRLMASTTHYALHRMKEDGLVRELPPQEIAVPVGHGRTTQAMRPVYESTAKGSYVWHRHKAAQFGLLGQPAVPRLAH